MGSCFSNRCVARRINWRCFASKGASRLQICPTYYMAVELCVVEVNVPNGGVFHPKIWLLRFRSQSDDDDVVFRLLVLSRNLTNDRSWDLSLSVDGTPGKRGVSGNRPLAELIRPSLIFGSNISSDKENCFCWPTKCGARTGITGRVPSWTSTRLGCPGGLDAETV